MQPHFYDTVTARHPDKVVRRDAQQTWSVGQIVNVGFVRGLVVKAIEGSTARLWAPASNRFYSFTAHRGLVREA